MLVLVLLGCQALASEMMDFEDATNRPLSICDSSPMFIQARFEMVLRFLGKKVGVMNWPLRLDSFNVNSFVDYLERKVGTFKTRSFKTTHVDGGVWIHGAADEIMLSAYMHPSRNHSAAILAGATGQVLPAKQKIVGPGQWCVVFGNPNSTRGNKPLYKIV